MADYEPTDAASWTAIIEAANSRRNFISGLSSVVGDNNLSKPVLRELFGGYHVSATDGFSFRGDVRWPFFLDAENPVATTDFGEYNPQTGWRDFTIRGLVPEFHRALSSLGRNTGMTGTLYPQQYYKELARLYPNFFIRKPSGTVLANYADFLRDAAGVISEMRVTPLSRLRWPGATVCYKTLSVAWLADDGQLQVKGQTLTGFASKQQVIDWMKAQWQNTGSPYVDAWRSEGFMPGSRFDDPGHAASFTAGRNHFTDAYTFIADARWLQFTANGFAADVPVRTWCVNAPTTWDPPRYDSFDYDRPVSGTYGDVNPGSSPDWKYLISTVDTFVIGNLSSDFTLGATFPFPVTIPDADYGNSIEVGYGVPYSLYAADLSNAVIHLE